MEGDSRLSRLVDSVSDFFAEQEWVRQLKAKWDDLDPKSQLYLRLGSLVGGGALVVFATGSFLWSVHGLKKEVSEKAELVQLLQSANDEMRRLKESGSSAPVAAGTEPWSAYFTGVAAPLGLGKENFSVSEEKKAAGESDQVKESLYDLSLKKVNIRQVVRLAFSLENGARPVKIRNLLIDTKEDPTGYMDATLSVSAFTVAAAGK
ncbi:MAG: hypothetical protein NDJ89_11575 [Oligoflexia bacterium]|nr:hypothetical protein [Oligoflexia bacterium]